MASDEDHAYQIMKELDVDYVLVIFGGLIGYSSDGEIEIRPEKRNYEYLIPLVKAWLSNGAVFKWWVYVLVVSTVVSAVLFARFCISSFFVT